MKNPTRKLGFVFVLTMAMAALSGCMGMPEGFAPSLDDVDFPTIPSGDGKVVHARMELPLRMGGEVTPSGFTLFGKQEPRDFDISLAIAAKVDFNVNPIGFFIPGEPYEGVLDFGQLTVDVLKDNALKACNGQKCTQAGIRVYTKNTPAAGLWNNDDSYGLPILTAGSVVGLGEAGAVVVGLVNIGNSMRVIKLCHFTQTSCSEQQGPGVPIPVSVDFTDAGAGFYTTTLVVEYFLQ